jgi:hypothetical protein
MWYNYDNNIANKGGELMIIKKVITKLVALSITACTMLPLATGFNASAIGYMKGPLEVSGEFQTEYTILEGQSFTKEDLNLDGMKVTATVEKCHDLPQDVMYGQDEDIVFDVPLSECKITYPETFVCGENTIKVEAEMNKNICGNYTIVLGYNFKYSTTFTIDVERAGKEASGDVNGDSNLNISDFVQVIKYFKGAGALGASQLQAADMNKDKSINVFDLNIMKKKMMAE